MKPFRVQVHRNPDGFHIARHAADEQGAPDGMRIQLPVPAVGKGFGGGGSFPAEEATDIVGFLLFRQRLEKRRLNAL